MKTLQSCFGWEQVWLYEKRTSNSVIACYLPSVSTNRWRISSEHKHLHITNSTTLIHSKQTHLHVNSHTSSVKEQIMFYLHVRTHRGRFRMKAFRRQKQKREREKNTINRQTYEHKQNQLQATAVNKASFTSWYRLRKISVVENAVLWLFMQ